jgi:hypothetical protein
MDKLLRTSQADTTTENYAENQVIPVQEWLIDVEEAEYVDGHKLRLLFSDQTERVVDFEPFLSKSLNPLIRKYLDMNAFKQFSVEYGDLIWNDYDLCFPIADLYWGEI